MTTPDSPMTPRGRTSLNESPPLPPPNVPRGTSDSLIDNENEGTGAFLGGPHMIALQGMAGMEANSRLISSVLPGLAPALVAFIDQLKMILPRAMAEITSGAPAGAPPPGSMSVPPMPPGMPVPPAPAGGMGEGAGMMAA